MASLHRILSDAKTMVHWPKPFKFGDTAAWVNISMKSFSENGFGRFPLMLRSSGELIGDTGIMLSNVDGKSVHDLGYIIFSKFWGMGFATEAALKIMNHAFDSSGIKELSANMAYNNFPSIRVAEKIGMKKERKFFNKKNMGMLTYFYSTRA